MSAKMIAEQSAALCETGNALLDEFLRECGFTDAEISTLQLNKESVK